MSKIPDGDELLGRWAEDPSFLRSYLEVGHRYDDLASEIAYILRKRLTEAGIEIASVTHRTKTLNSLLEKIARKQYYDPLSQITDLAGVRVVFLYASDALQVEELISREFEVVDRSDKRDSDEPDRFGYSALHFLVRLGHGSSGARYDDLRDLVCEIQVRTVMQDAWAIIDHHLRYKQESAIPKELRRKVHSLAGLFSTADDQFDSIRREREKYVAHALNRRTNGETFLGQEINLDTLTAFLIWKYPPAEGQEPDSYQTHARGLLDIINPPAYRTLRDLDSLLKRTAGLVREYARLRDFPGSHAVELYVALGFESQELRETMFSEEGRNQMQAILAAQSGRAGLQSGDSRTAID